MGIYIPMTRWTRRIQIEKVKASNGKAITFYFSDPESYFSAALFYSPKFSFICDNRHKDLDACLIVAN